MKDVPQKVATEVARLVMLRDIAIPYAKEMEEAGRLDLDVFYDRRSCWRKSCGTVGCLLGHMATLHVFRDDGWDMDEDVYMPTFNGIGGFAAARQYFGIDPDTARAIFGVSDMGSLKRRAAIVDRVIACKVASCDG